MKVYAVVLEETTEHVVQVKANSESAAREEAVRGWKEGCYVDNRAMLLSLEPTACYEEA